MTREEIEEYIFQQYGTEPEYPWLSSPSHAVFRHSGNQKWFAVAMNIPKEKLGLADTETIDILNVKCDPILGLV